MSLPTLCYHASVAHSNTCTVDLGVTQGHFTLKFTSLLHCSLLYSVGDTKYIKHNPNPSDQRSPWALNIKVHNYHQEILFKMGYP